MPSYSSIKPSTTFGTDAGKTYIQAGVDSATITSLIPTTTAVSSSTDLSSTGNFIGDQALIGSNLYIWNGSGWYRIALINASPTWDSGGQPSSTYILDADSPQDATIINLSASDPDGITINYSYVTSGSMDSMATISQDSSVFTITPKTLAQLGGEGNEGPYTGTITFRASDGVNILPQVSSFTLNFISIIENSRYTTLLVTATGTSDNNNITDASTNNHTITVNADAHAGTFSPYRSGGYSMYFDGSDYVDLGTGNLAIDTEDFTIETWVNVTLGSNMSIANNSNWNSGDNIGWRVLITTGGLINLTASQGTWNSYPSIYASTNAIPSNEWVHVVICRDSGVISSYINGIKDPNTVNYSASLNQTGGSSLSSYSLIGAYIADGSEFNNLTGYLSDFHFKLGSAKYTTTFSPPTERLTVESGTDVLLFNKPFLKDESTNAYTTSISGDPKIKPLSPYDYLEYSVTDHGGSVYFDGTGDALRIADNSNIQLGTSSFTIEGWFYCTDTAPTQGILAKRDGSSEYWRWIIAGGNLNFRFQSTGLGSFTCNSVTIPSNTWCHFAITRDNNNDVRQFVNGISTQSAINSTGNFDISGASLRVGEYELNTGHFNGYISDIKIVKNSALYTSNFTPPTAPLSSSGALLHIKGTDASIIDKSQSRNIKITSNITSTTQTKFANTRSIYFGGSTSVNLKETLIFPTTNTPFTGELWFYPTNVAGGGQIIGQADAPNGGRLGLHLGTDGRIRLYWQGANDLYSTNSISDNQWHHIAFVRKNNGYLAVYVNGTETELAQDNNNRSIDGSLTRIGSNGPSYFPSYIQGYIQDVRFTNGLARYTANFTPPTKSLEG